MKRAVQWGVALQVMVSAAGAAHAQRAYDNALTSAEDAFGTTVGAETIGLYNTNLARGFNPSQAGNVRIEGLFFDQQSGLGNQLIRGSTVRVGLAAQSYPFPAPTGIADFQLRLPGDKPVTSVVATYGNYDRYSLEVTTQQQLFTGKLGVVAGATINHDAYDWASDSLSWSVGGLLHWRPTENIEVIPFYSRAEKYDWEVRPYIFPAGPFLPPKIGRRDYFSQNWADWEPRETNFGFLTRARWDNWTLRSGLFRSLNYRGESYLLFYRNTQLDKTADVFALSDPLQRSGSYSGEVRATGAYTEGPRRHTVHVTARGRDSRRLFGGADVEYLGPGIIGEYTPYPQPNFVFSPQGYDKVLQGTVGAAYEGRWLDVGEASFGVQKTFYQRTITLPGAPAAARTSSQPWLLNATLAIHATHDLAIYGSYTRGLEEASVAPDDATNRGEALPAILTRQIDAGIRYSITDNLRFVAGVFEISKPYQDRDAVNLFTTVGSSRAQGVEVSLSGRLAEGLTAVAGAVLLKVRINGFTVDQGLIGEVPPGRIPRSLRLSLQYGPESWRGFAVDGEIRHEGARFADRANTFKISADTVLDLGARYQFRLGDTPASVRAQVQNVFNTYGWHVFGTQGWYFPLNPRRYNLRLSADF